MGTDITFKRADGRDVPGYLSNPANCKAPSVIVIQEWWGVCDQIKGLCDRFSLAGFGALAPSLYDGRVVPYHDRDAAGREMDMLDLMDATVQTVRAAAQYLACNGAKVGLTGFCLGGVVAVIGAAKVPELAAASAFYGLPPEGLIDVEDICVPIQGHFANTDDWCTPQMVDAFEKAMTAARKPMELYRYDAKHGFQNEQRPSHDRAIAELAWGRTTAFFRRHLQ